MVQVNQALFRRRVAARARYAGSARFQADDPDVGGRERRRQRPARRLPAAEPSDGPAFLFLAAPTEAGMANARRVMDRYAAAVRSSGGNPAKPEETQTSQAAVAAVGLTQLLSPCLAFAVKPSCELRPGITATSRYHRQLRPGITAGITAWRQAA